VIIGSATLGAGGGLGLWALLADARLVPGRSVMDNVMGRCDIDAEPPEGDPNGPAGKVLKASFYSNHRKKTVRYQVIYPPNVPAGTKLPVCIYLHGNGGDEKEADNFRFPKQLGYQTYLGMSPFVLVTIEGGDGYWHPRASGDNPLGMILEDLPIVLRQYNLKIDKLAIMGLSMGGFGALLAATEKPEMFSAVIASSPAVWHSFDESQDVNPAAFDSAEDFRAYGDLRTRVDKLKGLTVRIDCGESDSFEPNLRSLQELLPDRSVMHFAKGCHDSNFWRSVAPEQLKEIGLALTPPPPAAPPAS
jgi:enterochelin esterase-like enzyme